jgi:signal transduction histidine kinase
MTRDEVDSLVGRELTSFGWEQASFRLGSDTDLTWVGKGAGSKKGQGFVVQANGSRLSLPRANGSGISELRAFLPNTPTEEDQLRFEVFRLRIDLEMVKQVVKKNESRRDLFLGLVSHELKTPLTAISGVLQLQFRDDERIRQHPSEVESVLERRKHFTEVLLRQVTRLTELIDGLLDLSRIRLGKFTVEWVPCDITQVLKQAAMPRLTLAASESLLDLRLETPEHVQAVADPLRLEELFINLGMQAIRFSPEGATVSIRLSEHVEEGVWKVRVKDQGRPWPAEDRERLFEPYETAQHGGRMGGAGLGLFLARQIAELHGGQVVWLSPNGQWGNQLEVVIPLNPQRMSSVTLASS